MGFLKSMRYSKIPSLCWVQFWKAFFDVSAVIAYLTEIIFTFVFLFLFFC